MNSSKAAAIPLDVQALSLLSLPPQALSVLDRARGSWLKNEQVFDFLKNYQNYGFQVSQKPPIKPPGGSLFLFDRNVVRYFRKDGHEWRKKIDGKSIRETHEKLKVAGTVGLNCYYAHSLDDTLQRRSYWLLQADKGLVLVHYLAASRSQSPRCSKEPIMKLRGSPTSMALNLRRSLNLESLHRSTSSMSKGSRSSYGHSSYDMDNDSSSSDHSEGLPHDEALCRANSCSSTRLAGLGIISGQLQRQQHQHQQLGGYSHSTPTTPRNSMYAGEVCMGGMSPLASGHTRWSSSAVRARLSQVGGLLGQDGLGRHNRGSAGGSCGGAFYHDDNGAGYFGSVDSLGDIGGSTSSYHDMHGNQTELVIPFASSRSSIVSSLQQQQQQQQHHHHHQQQQQQQHMASFGGAPNYGADVVATFGNNLPRLRTNPNSCGLDVDGVREPASAPALLQTMQNGQRMVGMGGGSHFAVSQQALLKDDDDPFNKVLDSLFASADADEQPFSAPSLNAHQQPPSNCQLEPIYLVEYDVVEPSHDAFDIGVGDDMIMPQVPAPDHLSTYQAMLPMRDSYQEGAGYSSHSPSRFQQQQQQQMLLQQQQQLQHHHSAPYKFSTAMAD